MKTYKIVKRFLDWVDVEFEVKAKDEKQARKLVMKQRWGDWNAGNIKETEIVDGSGYEEIRSIEGG